MKKINDTIIKSLKIKIDDREILGKNIFPEVYSNIFICAPKKSSKTILIHNILNECADEDTVVYIFVSMALKDANWIAIINSLKKRKFFTNIETDINNLGAILELLKNNDVVFPSPEKSINCDKFNKFKIVKCLLLKMLYY